MTSATVRAENLFGKVGRGIRRKSGETFIEPYAFDRGCYLAPVRSLLVAAAVEVVWLAAYAATFLVTASPRPRSAAADPRLPLATQVMLALRARKWIPAAVDATYADLLRRGWLVSGAHQVRPGPGDGWPLSRAEEHVVQHVASLPGAPLHVLNEGPGAAGGWAAFGAAVIDDGKARGLVRDRVSGAVRKLLIVSGAVAPTVFPLLALDGDARWAVAVCALIFVGGLHAWLVKDTLAGHALTRAGATIAGPVAVAVSGSPLTAPRDNSSGWIHDEKAGWQQWQLEKPAVIRFSRWPTWILLAAAAAWTAGLLSLMSTSDDFGLDKVAVPLLGVYFGALAVRGLVGLYRALLLRRWRLEFERTRVPLDGLAVRKYKHTYSVPDSDGSHDVTDLIVVVAVSATGMAREFSEPERVYDTVQEGQTRVRALSGWQTREPVRFELLA
jgi:hypothetical protein